MSAAPARPALRYHGVKWTLAPWIVSHLPPHTCYVEPFGGAASVLLRKEPSPIEIYNDLDGRVVNFFRVLRDHTDDLVRAIELTPYSREELRCRSTCISNTPIGRTMVRGKKKEEARENNLSED